MIEDTSTCSRSFVALNNVPTDFGLKRSKELIQELVVDNGAVISVEYDKTPAGDFSKTNIIVELSNASFVDELLKTRCIEIEHDLKLHKILVTRPRLKSSSSQSNLLDVPSSSAERHDTSGAEVDAFRETRSVFCTRIPADMYNGGDLRYHFQRFGRVDRVFFPPNNKTYAIVYFLDHMSALRAIRSGGKMERKNGRMLIKWNRDERDIQRNVYRPTYSDAGNGPPNSGGQPRFGGHFRVYEQPISAGSGSGDSRAILQAHTSNWNQILGKERDFFTEPYKRCVLVQNQPGYARVSGDRLRTYFENLGHCGGRVVSMRRIVDGILVEFEDEETAESILVNEHNLDSLSLQIFPKTIPRVHGDCFAVEGNFENVDTLKAWLECGYSSEEFQLECHSENAIYLLRFSKPIEYQDLLNFAKKVPLEKAKPKIRELTCPDCIMVKNLSPDVSNDMIKFTFMNTNKTGGGPVTMVKRKRESTSALVYFSHYQDATNVVDTSTRVSIAGSNQVRVCLWHSHVGRAPDKKKGPPGRKPPKSLGKAADRTRSSVRSYERDLKCDNDVIEYVRSASSLMESLKSDLEQLAFVDFPHEQKPRVRFQPNFKKLNPGLNQVSFEEDCMKILENFLAKFTSRSETFNGKNLNQLRKSHIWSEQFGLIQVETDENSPAVQVFVRWNFPAPGGAKVTGLKHEIPEVIKWLKRKCDVSKERVNLPSEIIQTWSDFSIVDDVKEKFRFSDIRIRIDKTSNALLLEGPCDVVRQVKMEIAKCLQKVETSQLTFLDPYEVDFLRDAYAQSTTATNSIRDGIQARFLQKNVKAFFRVQPSFALVYYEKSSLTYACRVLNDYVTKLEIEVKRDFSKITQSSNWKHLEQDVMENQKGKVRFLKDKQTSKVILVGIKSSVAAAHRQISEHIKDNIVETRKVQLDGIFASFLQSFPEQIQASVQLAAVEWEVNLDKRSDVTLKGKCLDVAKAEAWLSDQKGSIKSKLIELSEPGMSQYFQSAKGKEFLQTTQTICKCIILIDSSNSLRPAISSRSSGNQQPVMAKTLLTGKLPGKNVTIHVVQNDITMQKCDAIVNASNEKLELRKAGISGAILQKGGASIQKEMDAAIQKYGGKLSVGFAETTSAGNLPCKEIIHVVGPTWTSVPDYRASMQLIQCVYSCLSECDRFKRSSIAIPAISCGIFGGKASKCVQLITESIVKYFNSQDTAIREIFLIELTNREVLNEFVTEVSKITGSKPQAKISSPSKPVPDGYSSPSRSPSPSFPAVASKPPEISLIQGDIASVTADVIVTSCTPKTFRSCTGSATSKALLAKAGPRLQNECGQLASSGSLEVGDVMTTSGYQLNCTEVFHILLKEYDGSNKEDVVLAIQTCLLMADSKKYKSIAFPAIGTGGMKYPADKLAVWLLEQITSFEGSSLRQVDLVLHQSDTNTISAFGQVFGNNQLPITIQEYNEEQVLYQPQVSGMKSAKVTALAERQPNKFSRIVRFEDEMKERHMDQHVKMKKVYSAFPQQPSTAFRKENKSHFEERFDQFTYSVTTGLSSKYQSVTSSKYKAAGSNKLTVTVLQGDILQTDCEALVCPTSSQYNLSNSQLSQMLLQRAGSNIQLQCANPLYQTHCCRVIQSSGPFSSKFIVFAVSPKQANDLTSVLTNILSLAETSLQVRSLALPAISTGNVGMNSSSAAQAMKTAFQNFQATNPQYLKSIEVVIYENQKLAMFQSALANLSPTTGGTVNALNQLRVKSTAKPFDERMVRHYQKVNEKMESNRSKVYSVCAERLQAPQPKARTSSSSLIPNQRSVSSVSSLTMDLCSNKDSHIDAAEKRIRKEVEEKSLVKNIENDVIVKLTRKEESEIMALETKHNVAVWKSKRSELVLSGLKDDVYKALESLAELLQDYKAALTCAEYVIWQYRDPKSAEMTDFLLRESSKIESNYKKDETGSFGMELTVDEIPISCDVDFHSMTACFSNMEIQILRCLKTSASAADELPSHWTEMGDLHVQLVTLSSGTTEYNEVINKFGIFSGHTIISLQRIQNPTLFKQFVAQKHKVESRMQQRGIQHPVTRELFHGTSGDVCARIYKDGFDRSYCGKHGTSCGKGVYFATSAQYSHGYASRTGGNCHMFLAEVITGEYCNGNSSMNVPPSIPNTDTQYDSTVNNQNSPSMFVVFKDASVYPRYIVTYS